MGYKICFQAEPYSGKLLWKKICGKIFLQRKLNSQIAHWSHQKMPHPHIGMAMIPTQNAETQTRQSFNVLHTSKVFSTNRMAKSGELGFFGADRQTDRQTDRHDQSLYLFQYTQGNKSTSNSNYLIIPVSDLLLCSHFLDQLVLSPDQIYHVQPCQKIGSGHTLRKLDV